MCVGLQELNDRNGLLSSAVRFDWSSSTRLLSSTGEEKAHFPQRIDVVINEQLDKTPLG
jgi:hypothetical protein